MRPRSHAVILAALVALVAAGAFGAVAFVQGHATWFPWAFRYGHDWRGALVDRWEGADGLRIHSTLRERQFDLEPHDGDVLFETHDAAATRAFLDLVRIDDRVSGGHCLCIGGDEIDVLRGDSVLVSFFFKHGAALRSNQLWPGDAALTAESAEAVCAWLVAHGVEAESPRARTARIEAETAARDAAQDALLGPDRARALRACTDDDAVAALLAEAVPDLTDRVVVAARLLELHPGSESPGAHDAGADALVRVRAWLRSVDDSAAVAAAFERLLADVHPGPVRSLYLYGYELGATSPSGVPSGLRLRVARLLLASPSDEDRWVGVGVLDCAEDTPEVRALLVGLLPPAGADGRPVSRPTADQRDAAQLVVRFCDPSMFPRLQAIADAVRDYGNSSKRMARRIAARRDPTDADPLYETMDVLPRSPLEGVVRAADGTPVAGASVRLTERDEEVKAGHELRSRVRAETDAAGRYRLAVPVGQVWTLSVVHEAHPYLLRRRVDLREPPFPATDLTLPRERTIRGRALDADGRPLVAAVIRAARTSPFRTDAEGRVATTAPDGTFEFDGFDADAPEVSVTLTLESPGDDAPPRERRKLTVRPDDPPVELRLSVK